MIATRYAPAVRDALAGCPEWWVLGLGTIAWLATVSHGLSNWGHYGHRDPTLGTGILHWQIMVMAMMLPVIAYQARTVAQRCFAERRHGAIAAFIVGYMLPWTLFGTVVMSGPVKLFFSSTWTVPALCGIAAIWATLPLRERAMVMVYGHEPVIAPDGVRRVWDCTTSGLLVGTCCVASCWPLMLACAASGHHLLIVAAGGAISLIERTSFRPPTRFVVLACSALVIFFAYPNN